METPSIAHQRGFSLSHCPDSLGFVLVKAGVSDVSAALARIERKTVIVDVYKNYDNITSDWILVWQYTGHDWTMFYYKVCTDGIPKALSKNLSTTCIYFEYEKVSGWERYSVFRDGDVIERYSFGTDYREELIEFHYGSAENMPEETDRGIPWDINTTDGRYQFVFRSTLRSVSEDEVKNYEAFLNDSFVRQDAWLPDWDDMPWVGEELPSESHIQNFVRVDFVTPI